MLILFLSILFLLLITTFFYKKNINKRLKAQTSGISLLLTPKEYILEIGQVKEAVLTLNNPLGKKIVGINLGIRYNPNIIQPESISVNAGSNKLFTDNFSPPIDNQRGEVRIVLFANKKDSDLSSADNLLLAIIRFKAIGGGKNDIFIDQNYEIISFSSPSDDFKQTIDNLNLGIWQVAGPSITLEPNHNTNMQNSPIIKNTSNLTPIAKGNIQLRVRLKFQGVFKKPQKITTQADVKISLQGKLLDEVKEKIISLAVNDQAIWEGLVSFSNIPLVSEKNYQIKIKVPKHLEIKTQDLLLTEGENELDLTNDYVLAGDINDDNLINAYDLAFIRNNLNSKDFKIINRGDLNFDQNLNAVDFSLALQSLNSLK